MHEGIPRGGPLVPEALARANAALGNPRGACAIEIYGAIEIAARGRVAVSDDRGGATTLGDGETIRVATEGKTRVRYVAVAGGIDVPEVLGGRGTMLAIGIGGYEGRVLRRGDRVSGSESGGGSASGGGSGSGSGSGSESVIEIEVVEGDWSGGTFTVGAASDRMGTRLEGGTPVVSAAGASTPMVLGAIELTPSGLIVLGPDHPTTGGYPVIAVVRSGSIGRLFSLPIGARAELVAT
ncbi:MAG: biotin-dependent carboxyltransferase family protein [Labilithrix sp.]|nr:biotin-dependent carboxyltransferase family protein [Labilithrix sp.]